MAGTRTPPGINRHGRALRKECGRGWTGPRLHERAAVESFDVAGELDAVCGPNPPARMLDAVLQRAPIALPRVAPVMLRDELFLASVLNRDGLAAGDDVDCRPIAPVHPPVRDRVAIGAVACRQGVSHPYRE